MRIGRMMAPGSQSGAARSHREFGCDLDFADVVAGIAAGMAHQLHGYRVESRVAHDGALD